MARLAWLNTGPRCRSTPVTPAASSHWAQASFLSRRRRGTRERSDGSRSRAGLPTNRALHTGNNTSSQRRVTCRPGQFPSPCRIAMSIASRTKSTCSMVAPTLRSTPGWAAAKVPSRCTSHFAAKLGEVLTVSTPLCSRRWMLWVPASRRSKASRTTSR